VIVPAELAEAVQAGARSARQAMADPREADPERDPRLRRGPARAARGADRAQLVRAGAGAARQALAYTPKQLPVLAKAGVVDAGAKGFVDLLEGINDFIEGGHAAASAELQAESFGDWSPSRRTRTSSIPIPRTAGAASACCWARASTAPACAPPSPTSARPCVGRRFAFAHPPARARGRAAGAVRPGARFGRVESTKADDMRAQARSAAGGSGVAIVTDSSADLPKGIAEELDIHVVPLRLNFGDQDYLDKVGLTPHEFYRKLREEVVLPRTSQPPPGDFRRQFEFLLSHHPAWSTSASRARCPAPSSRRKRRRSAGGQPERTHVFDTANAAGGQALLAIAAAEMAKQGADAAAILARLPALRERTFTWAVTRDLTLAVRGGRIPRWGKPLVQALYLTPLAKIKPDGRLHLVGGMFGKRNIPARFAGYVARRLGRGQRWRVIVGHCDAHADGVAALQAMRALVDCEQGWLVETGPAVGAHAGPGALVISVQAMGEPGG
jgi:DegV family protein with EDD domain